MWKMAGMVVAGLALGGCELVDGFVEDAQGWVEQTAAVALVAQARADIPGQFIEQLIEVPAGMAGTVFVAEVQADAVSDLLVPGLDVALTGCGDPIPFEELDDGSYLLEPVKASCSGSGTVSLVDGDQTATLGFRLPPWPDANQLPTKHATGEGLFVNWSEVDYHAYVVVVTDGMSGEITFSNEPEGISEWLDVLTGTMEPGLQIPASAFPRDSLYVVALTGIQRQPADLVDGLNTLLSKVAAGRSSIAVVSTLPLP